MPESKLDCLASLLWQLMVNFNIIINILSLAQVFCLDKVGLIPLLRKLTRANQSLDREALWEAAETFHRLHQVLNSITTPLCPPSPLFRWSCAHLVEVVECMDFLWL